MSPALEDRDGQSTLEELRESNIGIKTAKGSGKSMIVKAYESREEGVCSQSIFHRQIADPTVTLIWVGAKNSRRVVHQLERPDLTSIRSFQILERSTRALKMCMERSRPRDVATMTGKEVRRHRVTTFGELTSRRSRWRCWQGTLRPRDLVRIKFLERRSVLGTAPSLSKITWQAIWNDPRGGRTEKPNCT